MTVDSYTCFYAFLFIVDVVIINNISLAWSQCQHIMIIKYFLFFFLSFQHLTKCFSPVSERYFLSMPTQSVLKCICARTLTDTLNLHFFLCVGVQSNTLPRPWFLEGNKNPTQLNLTQEGIKKCFLLSLDSANKTVSSPASMLLIQSGLRQQMDHQTLRHMNRLT